MSASENTKAAVPAPNYGATQDKDGKVPYEQGRAWEDRGTILGLLIDVGGSSAGQIMLLMPMIANSLKKSESFISCTAKLHPSLQTPGLVFLCEYLTGFALAFPVMAITGVMLIIGRNLLQKRFYYSMLKSRAVVCFSQDDPLKEMVFWAIVICYLHCLGYFFLVLYVCDQEGKFAITADGIKAGENELLMLGSCFSLLLLPGALFTVFFYGAYDVQGTLVPLSQYVHAAEEAEERLHIKGGLDDLRVVNDTFARAVLREFPAAILSSEGGYEEKCDTVKEIVLREKPELSKRPQHAINLFHSFWPGELILKPQLVGESEDYFKTLWFSIVSFFMVIFLLLLGFLVYCMGLDAVRAYGGNMSAVSHAAVLFFHFIIVMGFMWPFVESITWRWANTPLSDVGRMSTYVTAMHEA